MSYTLVDWSKTNRRKLSDFAARHPSGGIIAVDMDGTCIHNDTGAARFYRAVYEGFVDFSDETTAGLIPYERIRERLAELSRSYRKEDRLLRLGTAIGVFEALYRTQGIRVAFPWTPSLYHGHTREEFEDFTRWVLETEMSCPIGYYEAPVLPGEYWEETGFSPPSSFRVAHGIRPYEPMVRVLNNLRQKGFGVFVVSASEEAMVRMCVEAIGLDADGIAAMRLSDREGVLLPEVRPPVLVVEGKIEALKKAAGSDTPPVLAAGDTSNDLGLLNHSTDIALLVDHGKPWLGDLLSSVKKGLNVVVQEQFLKTPMYYTGE